MSTCPNCHEPIKRRVSGACPQCHVPLEAYKGVYFRAGTGGPTENILKYFEGLVSRSLSQGRPTPVIFTVPRMSARYRRELLAAEQLLKHCDWDLDLVKESLDILFTDKKFNWKNYNTLLWIDTDFTMALAIAKAHRTATMEQRRKEQKAVQSVLRRQDVFRS